MIQFKNVETQYLASTVLQERCRTTRRKILRLYYDPCIYELIMNTYLDSSTDFCKYNKIQSKSNYYK